MLKKIKRTIFDYPQKQHNLRYSRTRKQHYRCQDCNLFWYDKPFHQKCLGKPTYFDRKHIPSHVKSFNELASMGLTPTTDQQPAAFLRYPYSRAVLPLYTIDDVTSFESATNVPDTQARDHSEEKLQER